MVTTTQKDGETWFQCEECELLFDVRADAEAHEGNCDTDSPSYLQ